MLITYHKTELLAKSALLSQTSIEIRKTTHKIKTFGHNFEKFRAVENILAFCTGQPRKFRAPGRHATGSAHVLCVVSFLGVSINF